MLVPSATDDDYDDREYHTNLVTYVQKSNGSTDRLALAYLLRYETMVRQQEAEDMATIGHARACIERIIQLSGLKTEDRHIDLLHRLVSFADLERAWHNLEVSKDHSKPEYMTTDRQLMMVLRLLTQDLSEQDKTAQITWAEFIQAYKVCINGMETLQHLPSSDFNPEVRNRARNRTLSMLSLFKASSTKILDGFSLNGTASLKVVSLPMESSVMMSMLRTSPDTPNTNRPKIHGLLMKVLLTMILIVSAMTCASIYTGRMNVHGVSTFIQTMTKLGVEMKDHAESFTRVTMYTYLNSSSQQYIYTDTRESMRPMTLPSSTRHVMLSPTPLTGVQHVADSNNESISLPLHQNTKLGSQLVLPTILGGIVGAAGAPYAASMLQNLSALIVASSSTNVIAICMVATVVPMALGGFLSSMSQYARTSELEYFSME